LRNEDLDLGNLYSKLHDFLRSQKNRAHFNRLILSFSLQNSCCRLFILYQKTIPF